MSAKVPTTNTPGAFLEDSFKYSPLEHTRSLFIRFFQGLFAAQPPGNYHWTNDETSQIYIADENPIHDTIIGARPAISVTRGPIQFYSLGLDDMLAYDFATETKKKSVLVPGTMTLNCCSRVPIESEFIAWACAENLWLHRELLMRAGFFEIGRQPALGAPTPAGSIIVADSGDEWYVTPVTCPFQFYRTSQTSPLNRKVIQEINLSLQQALQPVGAQGGDCGPVDGGGANLPVGITATSPPAFAPQASDVYGGTPNPGAYAEQLPVVPHPLNPAQMVTVRVRRPYCPAVKPAGTIPLSSPPVEESCGGTVITSATTVKV